MKRHALALWDLTMALVTWFAETRLVFQVVVLLVIAVLPDIMALIILKCWQAILSGAEVS